MVGGGKEGEEEEDEDKGRREGRYAEAQGNFHTRETAKATLPEQRFSSPGLNIFRKCSSRSLPTLPWHLSAESNKRSIDYLVTVPFFRQTAEISWQEQVR